jgi:hypothetical protein
LIRARNKERAREIRQGRHPIEELDAVNARHPIVRAYEVEPAVREEHEGLLRGSACDHIDMISEDRRRRREEPRVIVDDEDAAPILALARFRLKVPVAHG